MVSQKLTSAALGILVLASVGYGFTTLSGTNDYVTYEVGGVNTRVVMSASHGGTKKPDGVANRPSHGCYDIDDDECAYEVGCEGNPGDIDEDECSVSSEFGDLNTQKLARETAASIAVKMGSDDHRPHVIINELHRSKLDANRDLAEAAFGGQAAEQAWKEYHDFIDQAKTSVTTDFGQALYIDIHGQSQKENWTMIGVLLPKDGSNGLAKSQIRDRVSQYSSIKQLHYDTGVSMEELVRGENSIGGLLQASGYKTVPSPVHMDAGGAKFYQGGYSLRRHTGWTVSGFQVEAHYNVRKEDSDRLQFADKLADAIIHWIQNYYN